MNLAIQLWGARCFRAHTISQVVPAREGHPVYAAPAAAAASSDTPAPAAVVETPAPVAVDPASQAALAMALALAEQDLWFL